MRKMLGLLLVLAMCLGAGPLCAMAEGTQELAVAGGALRLYLPEDMYVFERGNVTAEQAALLDRTVESFEEMLANGGVDVYGTNDDLMLLVYSELLADEEIALLDQVMTTTSDSVREAAAADFFGIMDETVLDMAQAEVDGQACMLVATEDEDGTMYYYLVAKADTQYVVVCGGYEGMTVAQSAAQWEAFVATIRFNKARGGIFGQLGTLLASATAAPTAQPKPVSVESLKAASIAPWKVSVAWTLDRAELLGWRLYQAGALWEEGTANANTTHLSLDIVPGAAFEFVLIDKQSGQQLRAVTFTSPEPSRYSSVKINMFRLCNAKTGANYFSSYRTLRDVSVSDITDTSKFLYVLYNGEKLVSGSLTIQEQCIVIYRDGRVVNIQRHGVDTLPSSWDYFQWYFGIDPEDVSTPGNYSVSLYFDGDRLATTTFSVR